MIANIPQKLEKKISKTVARCCLPWQLIQEGDRIMVAFSGGKDSILLIHFLELVKRVAPIKFTLGIFHLNQSAPDFPAKEQLERLAQEGYDVWHEDIDMAHILAEKVDPSDSPCGLCSRLRRGILYTQAQRHNYNKIALGHHREDAIESLLMNAMFNGQIKAMSAKLHADNGIDTVIRPFLYTPEAWLIEAANYLDIPISEQSFCTRAHSGQRHECKKLLEALEAKNPNIRGNLLRSLHHVVPSHLMDPKLR